MLVCYSNAAACKSSLSQVPFSLYVRVCMRVYDGVGQELERSGLERVRIKVCLDLGIGDWVWVRLVLDLGS